jgi:signal transduction histidine kinase
MSFIESFKRFITARTTNKDVARKTFILNILLLSLIFLAAVAFFRNCLLAFTSGNLYHSLTPPITFAFLVFLLFLFFLSKKGRITISAIIFISFLFLSAFYTTIQWGADVPQAWLMFALIIVMSGILISTRVAFVVTLVIAAGMIGISYLQLNHIISPALDWKKEQYSLSDTIVRLVTIGVIAAVSWLSNREIEKSLHRARISEKALIQERDLLEIKVEERTKALKQAQLEKITQLYRFAEIGRLSSSLFHDLVTPLSLVSLNLEKLKHNKGKENIETMQHLVKRAINGTKYLEAFVLAVRKQLQNQETRKTFSVEKEIKQVTQMLLHKAKSMKIKIILNIQKDIKLYGNQVKFSQLMTNLLLNAIDSYENVVLENKTYSVYVHVYTSRDAVMITIKDEGKGIVKENIKKIFQPFFTTKPVEKGTGIGLSISRDIVEKSFMGKIMVRSTKADGTIFTVMLPLLKKSDHERPAHFKDHS